MALLEIRDLRVNYGPIQAIRGIDMDVEEGSIVALLGANGAGKTTTLRKFSIVFVQTTRSAASSSRPPAVSSSRARSSADAGPARSPAWV